MNKKSLSVVAIAILLLGGGWVMHVLTSRPSETRLTGEVGQNPGAQAGGFKARVVRVDDVVGDPEKYNGVIGIEGTIIKVDESNAAFTLGCEDACILMPARFNGHVPKEGTNVIAYGEIKKTEQAKYIFVAQKIKAK